MLLDKQTEERAGRQAGVKRGASERIEAGEVRWGEVKWMVPLLPPPPPPLQYIYGDLDADKCVMYAGAYAN